MTVVFEPSCYPVTCMRILVDQHDYPLWGRDLLSGVISVYVSSFGIG